jgi:hypothetical protein
LPAFALLKITCGLFDWRSERSTSRPRMEKWLFSPLCSFEHQRDEPSCTLVPVQRGLDESIVSCREWGRAFAAIDMS